MPTEAIVVKEDFLDKDGKLNEKIAQGLCTIVANGLSDRVVGSMGYHEFKAGEKISWEVGGNVYTYVLPQSISIMERKTNNPKKKDTVTAEDLRYHVVVGDEILGKGTFKTVKKFDFDIKADAEGQVQKVEFSKKIGAFLSQGSLYEPEHFANEEKYIAKAPHGKKPQKLLLDTHKDKNLNKYNEVILSRFIAGKNLFNIVDEYRYELGFADFLVIANEIKQALDEFHQTKSVHHDLKPDNILFTTHEGKANLIDFQFSNDVGEKNDAIFKGGAKDYMAPERLVKKEVAYQYTEVKPNSDYYSFGATLEFIFNNTSAKRQATAEECVTVEKVIASFKKEIPFHRPHSLTEGCKPLDDMLSERLRKAYSNMTVFIDATLERLDDYIKEAPDSPKKEEFKKIRTSLIETKNSCEALPKEQKNYQNYVKAYNTVRATIQNIDRDTLSAFKKGTILHFIAKHFSSQPAPAPAAARASQSGFFKPKSMKVVKEIEKSFNRMEEHAPHTLKGR